MQHRSQKCNSDKSRESKVRHDKQQSLYRKQNWKTTEMTAKVQETWYNNILSRESKVQHTLESKVPLRIQK